MTPRPRLPALFALAATLLTVSAAHAQEFAGVARGADGQPLAGVPVAVHRVGGGGGAAVATGTTADDGTFRFDIAMADSAVYFGAIRYNGSMYLGPGVRGGEGPVTGYVIEVSPDAEVGAVASALGSEAGEPGGGAATGAGMQAGTGAAPVSANGAAGAALLIGFLALATAGIFVTAAPAYRRRRTRDDLIGIATLQNGLDSMEPGPERDGAERKIRDLKERLLPGG